MLDRKNGLNGYVFYIVHHLLVAYTLRSKEFPEFFQAPFDFVLFVARVKVVFVNGKVSEVFEGVKVSLVDVELFRSESHQALFKYVDSQGVD